MTWTYSDEYYKEYTRETWNESAEHYGPILVNCDKYNPALLEAADLRPGQRVLDVGTGPGEPALTAAGLVGPDGAVLGIDLSEEMVARALQLGKQRQAVNARFEVMDAEALDVEDASVDVVLCRFGLQIVTDPEAAIAEAYRVLEPGGRFAATVWASPGERCPAIHIFVEPMLSFAEPDETGYLPTPYEMGGPGELVALFEAAGFEAVRETTVVHDWTFESQEAYIRALLDGTPIGHSLWEEDEEVQRVVMERARENLAKYVLEDRSVAAPSEAVVVVGTKPG